MKDVSLIVKSFDKLGYIVDEELATVLYLVLELGKPLLLEGNPGVGKTEAASILAAYLKTDLIRLQCYEGLDVNSSVYEWNYQKQLLSIKLKEISAQSDSENAKNIFSKDFLLERPLLKAITSQSKSPVLLIDEIDRADEEFEAFLLELLSVFQISIPELGTITALHKPFVILTSNRTRNLSEALRRRCLYHWIDYPDFEKEVAIVKKHLPEIEDTILNDLLKFIHVIRTRHLEKGPGVSESIDWAESLVSLGIKKLSKEHVDKTIGCVLKNSSDIQKIRLEGIEHLLAEQS